MLYKLALSISIMLSPLLYAISKEDFLLESPHDIVSKMSLDEKIGQLCVIAAVADEARNSKFMQTQPYKMDRETVCEWIIQHTVGGIIFLGESSASQQIIRVQEYQSKSKYPLLTMQDCEWGPNQRAPELMRFPMAMTLSALPPESEYLVKEMGYQIGLQMRLLGIHMNLAPVVDVNNNANNPVIYMRSFGDNTDTVSRNAISYMHGLQKSGILTCAKHFPGHGNTDADSHSALPVLTCNLMQLQNTELIPFQNMIMEGVDAVMTAHLAIPAVEPEHNRPASLSVKITTGLLQDKLKFKGLIITDGLGMQGVTNHFKPGDLELQALLAGNDILLCPVDLPAAIATIKNAVLTNTISLQELNKRVLKIVTSKQHILQTWAQNPLPAQASLNSKTALNLKKKLYAHATTLIHSASNLLPLQLSHSEKLSIISFSNTDKQLVKALTEEYPHAQINIVECTNDLDKTVLCCQGSKAVIVPLIGNNRGRVTTELSNKAQKIITLLNEKNLATIGILCASPYLAPYLKESNCLIAAYENDPDAQIAAIQVLSGKVKANGHLPVIITGINN